MGQGVSAEQVAGAVVITAAAVGTGIYVWTLPEDSEDLFSKPAPKSTRMQNFTKEQKHQKLNDARTKLNMDAKSDYNFAFCGAVKAGKSSLINALRGIKDTDVDAAKVHEWECTTEITSYRFTNDSRMQHAVLWDIPGSGTLNIDSETYFEDNFLYAFDCIFILFDGSIHKEDVIFAQKALHHHVPIVFIRSKCDNDLRNRFELLSDNEQIKEENDNLRGIRRQFLADMKSKYRDELNKCPGLSSINGYFVSAKVFKAIASGAQSKLDREKLPYLLDELLFFNMIVNAVRMNRLDLPSTELTIPEFVAPYLIDIDE